MSAITVKSGKSISSSSVPIALGKNTTTPSVVKKSNDALFFKHLTRGK